MLVSVIVPVYNVAPYLDECLESICCQTYKELEIILVDDGSTDGSGDICDEWCKKDQRVRVIHKENGGVSNARNEGLRICGGDLISFIDSDDWIDLDMYEKLVKCLIETHSDVAMCGYVDYPHGQPVNIGCFPVDPCDFTGAVYQIIRRRGYFTSSCAKIFSRDLVFKDGIFQPFDSALDYGEDEVWVFQILRNCKKVSFVPEPLYYWRPREGSITRLRTITDKNMTLLDAKKKALSLLPNDARLQKIARGRVFNDCFSLKVLAYCSGDKEAQRTVSREIRSMLWDWIRSPEVIFLRKCKLCVLEVEMLCRLPVKLVRKTDALTS